MPELPEVQTVVDHIRKDLLEEEINNITAFFRQFLRDEKIKIEFFENLILYFL